jgi:hypothetical protein
MSQSETTWTPDSRRKETANLKVVGVMPSEQVVPELQTWQAKVEKREQKWNEMPRKNSYIAHVKNERL